MRFRDRGFGATATSVVDPEAETLQWAMRWHQLAQALGRRQGAEAWVLTREQLFREAGAAGVDLARLDQYTQNFATFADYIYMALQPPAQAAATCAWGSNPQPARCPWKMGAGRSRVPSMRNRVRACLETTAGLFLARIHRYPTLQAAGDSLAKIMGIPFSRVGVELNTYLGVPPGPFYAWEDGHVVTGNSPEAEWYWANEANYWTATWEQKLVGGDMGEGCDNGDFSHRVAQCSITGHDPCDFGTTWSQSLLTYITTAGASLDLAIIITGALNSLLQAQNACKEKLKLEMVMKRNVWCYLNGMTPPSYPKMGSEALMPSPPDKVAAQYQALGLAPLPGTATAADTGLGLILAGAAAGFMAGGPPGAGIGAGIGLVLNMAAKRSGS